MDLKISNNNDNNNLKKKFQNKNKEYCCLCELCVAFNIVNNNSTTIESTHSHP
jgi:hypothetical protein